MAADECMGILWKAMNIQMSTYYPIAVTVGIIAAASAMLTFMKVTSKYRKG